MYPIVMSWSSHIYFIGLPFPWIQMASVITLTDEEVSLCPFPVHALRSCQLLPPVSRSALGKEASCHRRRPTPRDLHAAKRTRLAVQTGDMEKVTGLASPSSLAIPAQGQPWKWKKPVWTFQAKTCDLEKNQGAKARTKVPGLWSPVSHASHF